jgi:DNA-binding LytR/AlgR family response regulator
MRDVNIAIKTYKNAYELIRCLSCNCPDVLFYNKEDEDGLIHRAALLAKQTNDRLISVYTSEQADTILEKAYSLPSISRKHLWLYASLAYEAFLDDGDSFTYYVRPDYEHIALRDIIYFASEGRRTHIITNTYRDSFYQKLDEIENIVKPKNCDFLRIHKSYLVNTKYISGFSRNHVTLLNGDRLRVSKYDYYKYLNDNFRNLKVSEVNC